LFVTRQRETKEHNWKKYKGKKNTIKLLSKPVSSNCVHPKKIQDIFGRGGMVKQLGIRRCSKFGHEIRTMVILFKCMANSYITMLNQILHILDQDCINMIPHCWTFEVDIMQGVRVANKLNYILLFAKIRPW